MHRSMIAIAAAGLVAQTAHAGDRDPAPLEALRSLEGVWDASGGGAPGQGSGTVSFAKQLGGHVLVRTNTVSYPASGTRPAATHEDLLVLHEDAGVVKGIYFDNEGHVIRYTAAEPPAHGRLVLLSDPGAGPRFRLTHDWSEPDVLKVIFEIALPGSPEFKRYAEGRATRRAVGARAVPPR